MNNIHIELDHKYGLDGQNIEFIPGCNEPILKGDIITHSNIELLCVEMGTYRLVTNNSRDFVTGYDLLKEFKKL